MSNHPATAEHVAHEVAKVLRRKGDWTELSNLIDKRWTPDAISSHFRTSTHLASIMEFLAASEIAEREPGGWLTELTGGRPALENTTGSTVAAAPVSMRGFPSRSFAELQEWASRNNLTIALVPESE